LLPPKFYGQVKENSSIAFRPPVNPASQIPFYTPRSRIHARLNEPHYGSETLRFGFFPMMMDEAIIHGYFQIYGELGLGTCKNKFFKALSQKGR
jgi:hypothetical protein